MKFQTKRPLLLLGNSILLIFSLFHILSQIINFSSLITLFLFIFIFFFTAHSLKTVNMSKEEFKKGKWFSWISIILFFIYDMFEYAVIIRRYQSGYIDILKIAILFITLSSILISIFGILTRVIDNKITYENTLKNNK